MTFPDGSRVAEFMLRIHDDGTAGWRWHDEPFGAVEYVAGQLGQIVTSSPAMTLHERLPRLVRDVGGGALANECGATAFQDVEA
jgi:hypothetical protein